MPKALVSIQKTEFLKDDAVVDDLCHPWWHPLVLVQVVPSVGDWRDSNTTPVLTNLHLAKSVNTL